MAKKKNSKVSKKQKRALGAGVFVAGLAAAAAAGAYYLSTPQGRKHKKQLRGWMLRAKGEVMERLEDAKEINQESYEKIVDEVVSGYKKLKKVDTKDVALLVAELKDQWDNIKKEAKRDVKVVKDAKKTIKKRVKKASPKKVTKKSTAKKKASK